MAIIAGKDAEINMEMKTSTALKNAIAAMVWALDDGHAISDLEAADNTLYVLHKLLFAAEEREKGETTNA